ncbi:MAG TPA: hypothetical protein DGQ94_20305 [Pseudomonas sp.]|nr:hypothetical protein [Pseudomonas sp.]
MPGCANRACRRRQSSPSCKCVIGSGGLFAGKPAPSGISPTLKPVETLWERAYPRRGQHCRHIRHA